MFASDAGAHFLLEMSHPTGIWGSSVDEASAFRSGQDRALLRQAPCAAGSLFLRLTLPLSPPPARLLSLTTKQINLRKEMFSFLGLLMPLWGSCLLSSGSEWLKVSASSLLLAALAGNLLDPRAGGRVPPPGHLAGPQL